MRTGERLKVESTTGNRLQSNGSKTLGIRARTFSTLKKDVIKKDILSKGRSESLLDACPRN